MVASTHVKKIQAAQKVSISFNLAKINWIWSMSVKHVIAWKIRNQMLKIVTVMEPLHVVAVYAIPDGKVKK